MGFGYMSRRGFVAPGGVLSFRRADSFRHSNTARRADDLTELEGYESIFESGSPEDRRTACHFGAHSSAEAAAMSEAGETKSSICAAEILRQRSNAPTSARVSALAAGSVQKVASKAVSVLQRVCILLRACVESLPKNAIHIAYLHFTTCKFKCTSEFLSRCPVKRPFLWKFLICVREKVYKKRVFDGTTGQRKKLHVQEG